MDIGGLKPLPEMKPMKGFGEDKLHTNKQCPTCGSVNAPDAVNCVNCQTNLGAITPQLDTSQVATKQSPKYKKQPNMVLPVNTPIISAKTKVSQISDQKKMVQPVTRSLPYNENIGIKIKNLSVDDAENTDENHLQSVESSADSLAIE